MIQYEAVVPSAALEDGEEVDFEMVEFIDKLLDKVGSDSYL